MRFTDMLPAFARFRPAMPHAYQFAGIRWGDDAKVVKEKLRAAGHAIEAVDEGDIAFRGRVSGYEGTGWVYFAGKGATKVTFTVRPAPNDVLDVYDRLRSAFLRQYGATPHVVERFDAPYAKGDGKAAEAIQLGHTFIATAWRENSENAEVGFIILVTKDPGVRLSYEGPAWHAEAQRRRGG